MKGSLKKIFEMFSEVFTEKAEEKNSVQLLLENAKNEIREIRANIDSVQDEKVLDMYIYRLKAAEAQYRELLKMAREDRGKKIG